MSKFFNVDEVEFSTAMRGYDRAQVDRYAAAMTSAVRSAQQRRSESETAMTEAANALRRAEQRIQALERRLSDNADQIAENEQPTLSGMGARVERVLRAADLDADAQADEGRRSAAEIVASAKGEATKIIDAARVAASSITVASSHETSKLRAATKAEIAELVETAKSESDASLAEARRETELIRSRAVADTEKLKSEVSRQISVDKATAEREIAQVKAAAIRDADEQRAAAAGLLAEVAEARQRLGDALSLELAERREEFERGHSKRHAESVQAAQAKVIEAEEHSDAAEKQYRQVCVRADDRIVEADQAAVQTREDARVAIAEIVSEAKAQAARIRSEAQQAAESMLVPLRQEVAELERRQRTVSVHMADLRQQLNIAAGNGAAPSPFAASTPTQRSPIAG